MARSIFTAPAWQDLKDITRFVALKSPAMARRWVELVRQKCKLLAEFPEMGVSRKELIPDLRSLPCEDYLIFYRPIRNGIEVVRVLQGSRDLEAVFATESID